MKIHLWCRGELCTACHDCEAACVFVHNPDWKTDKNVTIQSEDKEKVQAILGQEPNLEQIKSFVSLREMIKNKEETPTFPYLEVIENEGNNYTLTCRHCEDPKCAKSCWVHAITTDKEGIVLPPATEEKCIGCTICSRACAFGIPRFAVNGKMVKCDLCQERLQAGKQPACVAVCATKALLFKDLKTVYAPKPQGNEKVGYGIRELWHNQKSNPEYMLRFRGNGGGLWTSDQLDVICKWADKLVKSEEYTAGYLDITLRQDIELHHLEFSSEEEKKEFFADLEKNNIYLGNFGPLFRNIVSCVGSSCSKARADAKGLGNALYHKLNEIGYNLPQLKGKIKVGISGCLEGCGHMRMYDLTVACLEEGEQEGEKVEKLTKLEKPLLYRLFLGGNMGRFPQPGVKVADFNEQEEIIDFIVKVAEYFKDYCELGNIHRLSYWIRVRYGKTGDPFIFSVEGIEKFLEEFSTWVKKKYGQLAWLKKLQIENPIPQSVFSFRDYHQKKLTPMDIYQREDVFPHLEGVNK